MLEEGRACSPGGGASVRADSPEARGGGAASQSEPRGEKLLRFLFTSASGIVGRSTTIVYQREPGVCAAASAGMLADSSATF
ncbi:hypothetical protein R6Z07F_009034 [Ovis aries]